MKRFVKKLPLLATSILLAVILSGCCISHEWADATCTEPVTCIKCQKTEGEPLGHTPTEATCTDPSKCEICNEHLANALGHTLIDATETTPKLCSMCDYMVPMAEPENGQVIIPAEKCYSKFTINEKIGIFPLYVVLKDEDGNTVISFYVRAGEKASVKVPRQKLYVEFVTGIDWYGPEYLFGKYTVSKEFDEPLNFFSYAYSYSTGET